VATHIAEASGNYLKPVEVARSNVTDYKRFVAACARRAGALNLQPLIG
jgi:hypothetical protein